MVRRLRRGDFVATDSISRFFADRRGARVLRLGEALFLGRVTRVEDFGLRERRVGDARILPIFLLFLRLSPSSLFKNKRSIELLDLFTGTTLSSSESLISDSPYSSRSLSVSIYLDYLSIAARAPHPIILEYVSDDLSPNRQVQN